MGMIVNGNWTEQENTIEKGAFVRRKSGFSDSLPKQASEAFREQPGRFVFIGSASCPWSHRAIIMRQMAGLAAFVPMHLAHGPRVQGYALNGGKEWYFPNTDNKFTHLHQLYSFCHSDYTGRATVPVLIDRKTKKILSNESAQITQAFDHANSDFTLFPDTKHNALGQLSDRIYRGLNNAVYRAGFSESQAAYESAAEEVFATLDWLEGILSGQRYLLGQVLTAVDWQLFVTLVRFDTVYYILHKCCKKQLRDYPGLWAFTRDLFGWHGISDTVDLGTIRTGSYQNDAPGVQSPIVAIAPDIDFRAPHDRERFGAPMLTFRSGRAAPVDPKTLKRTG